MSLEIFSFDGKINRTQFIINGIVIDLVYFGACYFWLFIVLMIGLIIHQIPNEQWFMISLLPLAIFQLFLQFHNYMKRARDIFGENASRFYGYSMFIPFVNLGVLVYLCFKKGQTDEVYCE